MTGRSMRADIPKCHDFIDPVVRVPGDGEVALQDISLGPASPQISGGRARVPVTVPTSVSPHR